MTGPAVLVAIAAVLSVASCSGEPADSPVAAVAVEGVNAVDQTTITPSTSAPVLAVTSSTIQGRSEPTAPSSSSTTITTTTTTVTVREADAGNRSAAKIQNTGDVSTQQIQLGLAIESHVDDVSTEDLTTAVLETLNDERGWPRAGFSFVADPASELRVVLAEGSEVDQLCLPLETYGSVSCQNGSTVALNADRWRYAFDGWDSTVDAYRLYLINHEVGHLLGQRHPATRCPHPGGIAGLMEPQTGGLKGCSGNGWPRGWEIDYAAERPVRIGPLPSWTPPHKRNLEPPNS